jgi:hypothetical protein
VACEEGVVFELAGRAHRDLAETRQLAVAAPSAALGNVRRYGRARAWARGPRPYSYSLGSRSLTAES